MTTPVVQLGRYTLHAELASGGMATVYLGRLRSDAGFSRTVAIKRLHPHLAKDPDFVAMFLDEARLAVRVQHPNVVPTLDVVQNQNELYLVLEYVNGEPLSSLVRAARRAGHTVPVAVGAAIIVNALHGLHAAHEARDEQGNPLCIVHRDVSPQNIMVGVDGVARVLDFGVAKAASRLQTTREGQLKGKIAYMPPEQLNGTVTRKTDIYAAGVVLWETLTGRRLFEGEEVVQVNAIMNEVIKPPSAMNADVPPELDAVVLKALSRDMAMRYETADEMARAIEVALRVANQGDVREWVLANASASLEKKRAVVAEVESGSIPSNPIAEILSSPHLPILGESSSPSTARPVESFITPPPRASRVPIVIAVAAVSLAAITAYFAFGQRAPVSTAAAVSPIVPPPTVAPSTPIASSASVTADVRDASAPASVVTYTPTTRPTNVRVKPKSSDPDDITSLTDTRK